MFKIHWNSLFIDAEKSVNIGISGEKLRKTPFQMETALHFRFHVFVNVVRLHKKQNRILFYFQYISAHVYTASSLLSIIIRYDIILWKNFCLFPLIILKMLFGCSAGSISYEICLCSLTCNFPHQGWQIHSSFSFLPYFLCYTLKE